MDETAPTAVVVGASAGGVEALTALAGGLPEDLDAAVCVVLHLPAGAVSRLAEIISHAGPLHAVQAHGGEPLVRGRIYVACGPARTFFSSRWRATIAGRARPSSSRAPGSTARPARRP